MKKLCNKCNIEKSLSDFYIDKKMKDGHINKCKKCVIKYSKNWNIKNPDKKKKFNEKWNIKNPEYVKNYNKKYKCKWSKEHEKHIVQYNKEWYQKNKKRVKENVKNYQRKRRKNDLNFKITHNLRTRLNRALKDNPKLDTTIKLVGCSIELLKQYLEKQFTLEMNWDNYGKGKYWEIDHIIPCSSFNLVKKEEQKKCFHYSNLQPLNCKDNREKSNKLNWIKQ